MTGARNVLLLVLLALAGVSFVLACEETTLEPGGELPGDRAGVTRPGDAAEARDDAEAGDDAGEPRDDADLEEAGPNDGG